MSDKVPQTDKPPQYQPGEGIRSMRSTGVFRAINFELYAKPVRFIIAHHLYFLDMNSLKFFQNLVIMVIGAVCFTSALGYITYMRAKYESEGYYPAVQADGSEVFTKRRSKWD